MWKRFTILCVLYFVACTIPETRTYTIYIPDERGSVSENTDTAVTININSEHYLKQSYIAYRNSSYQIEISKYSKWESSPGKIIKNQFKNTLSRTGVFREVRTDSVAPTGSYSLKINLKQFERFDEGADSFGMLAFDADFLSPNGQNLYRSTIYKKIKLDSRNFSSLAKGLSTALKEGIDEINTNIISAVNKQITAP